MIKKQLSLFFIAILCFTASAFADNLDFGKMSGQLMIKDGGPLSNGMVVFFRADEGPVPDPDRYLRIPDEVTDLDDKGFFSIRLRAGRYFMGAIKRMSGELIGPPDNGDYFFISQDSAMNPRTFVIEKDKNLKIGTISEAVPFKRAISDDATGISGTIRNTKKEPVKGAIVFAYFTATMTGLPPFTSYRTGDDGKYFISVSHKGKYYLRVRDVYGGGPPVPGALMGSYGEDKPAAVEVKRGKITRNIDMSVIKHLQRGPRRPEVKKPEADIQKEREKFYKEYNRPLGN